MDENIKQKLAVDFGFDKLPQLEQDTMLEKIGKALFEGVLEASYDSLSPQDLADYNKLIEDGGADTEKIIPFLAERVPNFSDIVATQIANLKKSAGKK
jgi:hypothetical protein